MPVTVYQWRWFTPMLRERISLDPTRMTQGIMTGIGFLGAGVIFKEALSVRGLTTAASIWITAAIGILAGIGFYFPAIVATLLPLGTLSVFRLVEMTMPVLFFAHFTVRFPSSDAMPEPQLRALVADHDFSIANLNYRLDRDDSFFEYRMVIRSHQSDNARRLAESLTRLDNVLEFRISPTGD